jgi:acetylornithine deacetylase/succinyl-diaminopimelate desuccinylase-like protein
VLARAEDYQAPSVATKCRHQLARQNAAMSATHPITPLADAEAEVVGLLQDLIRIDSTNFGDGSGPGEVAVADYIVQQLSAVGLSATRFSTSSDTRAGVMLTVPGSEASSARLLVHAHLDVVPAVGDWQHAPFGAEIADGMVWGRGAVDMKDGVATILACLRSWARNGVKPKRETVFLFLPDEEAGGQHGAHWITEHHREWFDGVTECIGEVGGFSFDVAPGKRMYLIETAEKGLRWMKLRSTGRAGHGSMLNDNNAVTALAEVLARIGRHPWPIRLTETNKRFLYELSEAIGEDVDPRNQEQLLRVLGPLAGLVGATFANSAQPTMLHAGYKMNVIPETADASVDGRVLPGFEDEFDRTMQELLGGQAEIVEMFEDIALETTFDGATVDAMAAAIRAEDPTAIPVPYLMSGGTDAKAFRQLGIRPFGFIPLQLPADLEFSKLFHGVNERVPVTGLQFGTRVMDRFLRSC